MLRSSSAVLHAVSKARWKHAWNIPTRGQTTVGARGAPCSGASDLSCGRLIGETGWRLCQRRLIATRRHRCRPSAQHSGGVRDRIEICATCSFYRQTTSSDALTVTQHTYDLSDHQHARKHAAHHESRDEAAHRLLGAHGVIQIGKGRAARRGIRIGKDGRKEGLKVGELAAEARGP